MTDNELYPGDTVKLDGKRYEVEKALTTGRLVLERMNDDVEEIESIIEGGPRGREVVDSRQHSNGDIRLDVKGPLTGNRAKIGSSAVEEIYEETGRFVTAVLTKRDGNLRVWFAEP